MLIEEGGGGCCGGCLWEFGWFVGWVEGCLSLPLPGLQASFILGDVC